MSNDLEKLTKQIIELKKKKQFEKIIQVLNKALVVADSIDEKVYLLSSIASEYQQQFNYKKAEQAINKCIELQSDSPDGWLNLAEHFHYYDVDLNKALSVIKIAIEKAVAEGNFLRQSLGVQARIALEIGQYGLFEKTLLWLIDYKPQKGSIDVSMEEDLVEKIPDGKINDSIIKSYKLALGKGNKSGTGSH